VVELEGRALFRADRSATGKTRGGGNRIYVNKVWCTDCVVMVTHCSADLEFLIIKCRPFYLPPTRSVKIWKEGADSFLQQEFKLTDWSEYAARATTDSHINIDIYTNSVLEHINNCVDRVTSHKTIITFPKQKPWMNREVRLLLKARDAAFRSGDREAYSSARANLRRGIAMAKHCYKQWIEEHFSSSDPRRMWQGIQTLTDYKPRSTVLANNSASLPDQLNHFYARFDRENMVVSSKTDPPLHDHPLTLSTLDVHRTLSRVNVRSTAGPDKTATIVPVPKHPTASAPNDFRPVALTPIISKCFERLVLSHLKSCLPITLDPHQFAYHSNSLNTGVPQGCVLSPILYSLFTHDCVPIYDSNSIIKYADDTTVIGLIKDNDETAYRDEVQHLSTWCHDNNLTLNTQKTKEIIMDLRRSRSQAHPPVYISRAAVEQVTSFKFLGTHISSDLTWSLNSSVLVKKAQQRLYFLRSLKKVHLSPRILVNFYRCTIESILTNGISVWYGNCCAADRKELQRVVKMAQRITGTQLPTIQDIYHKRCLGRARNIINVSHPNPGLFTLLPSGRRYRSLRSRTSRLRNSFFHEADPT
ncbi:hypothetical protein NFI96_032939, partial [Prochilodus magdalenae]